MEIDGFHLTCPRCRSELQGVNPVAVRCNHCYEIYRYDNGIWRFLLPERLENFTAFIEDYQLVRRAEKRVRQEHQYFRQLPFTEASDGMAEVWKIRAASYRAFVIKILAPIEAASNVPLLCLDLGAGNSWLSNRLVERGHQVAAVDLVINDWDGLGAHVHYTYSFLSLQAEFDRLPLFEQQCDLVIYNASFHYSTDYLVSLAEARRVLKPAGKIVILDTPVYQSVESGKKMVQERERHFMDMVGIPSNSLPAENYLTHARIRELSEATAISWKYVRPFYGLRWAARPWVYWLAGRREPAKFYILVGEQSISG